MTTLRGGYTTGSCATAAAKAAVMLLDGQDPGEEVEIALPDGSHVAFHVHEMHRDNASATAVVIKDAGDDPDVTHRAHITVTARWQDQGGVRFEAGEGVGTVTLPGLQIPPGEPAINPVPRRMMETTIREVTDRGVAITLSVPGGEKLAEKTFNPKLGVVGGISIIGTSGRVRPYSCDAIRQSLKCALDIAAAMKITAPVLVPGNIGARAAERHFKLQDHQLVHAGNEWGFMLDATATLPFERILVVGHPGKLAKLADGNWDTHSSRSPSAVGFVTEMAQSLLGRIIEAATTVDGLLTELPESERHELAQLLCQRISKAIRDRMGWDSSRVAVTLTDMDSDLLASHGDLSPWKETTS